uniref:Uncharacterized protein n=1 Tax=Octopus bimaculoides TaxID=37653 RepID=A0A0L8HFY9_OCTBM
MASKTLLAIKYLNSLHFMYYNIHFIDTRDFYKRWLSTSSSGLEILILRSTLDFAGHHSTVGFALCFSLCKK